MRTLAEMGFTPSIVFSKIYSREQEQKKKRVRARDMKASRERELNLLRSFQIFRICFGELEKERESRSVARERWRELCSGLRSLNEEGGIEGHEDGVE